MTDLQIARETALLPIAEIAASAGFRADTVIPYGTDTAKIDARAYSHLPMKGRLVLVTAINPTPAGEGKTTVSIALADGMRRIGRNVMLALREPSLGPVFGVKGGAAGGGYAQVAPMEKINLHFTGDLHAITAANNLLCAMIDNHIHQGNALALDVRTLRFRHCLDVNDRQLRQIVQGLGGKGNGFPREDGFDITAASEVMATFCLASDLQDLKARLGRILVGYTFAGEPVTASMLHAEGAMCALLRDAFFPNLVQTLEHTPCLMHGGPFANIAHGCNSVAATTLALRMAQDVVTEAGFGADLGAEKFLDIKCRASGIWPKVIVLVATLRALKCQGGVKAADCGKPVPEALEKGFANLRAHIRNIREVWHTPVIVALNRFATDTEDELSQFAALLEGEHVPFAPCEGWAKGGAGAEELAKAVCGILDSDLPVPPSFTYPDEMPLAEKIVTVAKQIYHAGEVTFAPAAESELQKLTRQGFGNCPVCIAKTQYSMSDDPKALGAPENYTLQIRSVRLSAGAGFVVAFAGSIIAMPGLPKVPAAESIDVDENGEIQGIF